MGGVASQESGANFVLSFTTSNEYSPITSSPWPHLVEPFRETTLTVSSAIGDPSRDGFVWTIWNGDDASHTVLRGR